MNLKEPKFDELKFDVNGLIPVIIQDINTKDVLMLAYMNNEALKKSLETGKTHFWSRSRQKLWMKGETSGHFQTIVEGYFDCDNDTLLFKVVQNGVACHTGHKSCFFNKIAEKGEMKEDKNNTAQTVMTFIKSDNHDDNGKILKELYDIVQDRRHNPKEDSYTNYLFSKGLDKILKKVGEEAAEVIIASKNCSNAEIIYEISDLIYHLMVLLVQQKIRLEDIYGELRKRR